MCILQSPDKSRVMNNGPDKFVQIKRYTPENWKLKQLGSVVKIISGVSPSLFKLNVEGNYPYLKVEDLNNCEKYQTKSRWYSNDEKYLIPENSVIFPKRGAAILNNKVRINLTAMQIDSNLMALNPNPLIINHEFLYYQLTFEQLYKIADTSSIPQINNKHIIPYLISLPPLPEQKAIASVLSTWDEAIQLTQELIAQKELQKKWLMQVLLTGKKRLKGFEGKWTKYGAGKIFKSVSIKGSTNNELLSATQDRGMIPRTMLEGRVTMPTSGTEGFKLVEEGDFVISLRSFQGGLEYSHYRGLVSPAYTVLKQIKKINDEFYKQYFKSYDFIGHLAIAVIGIRDGKQISYDDFCTVNIPSPSLEEQNAIAKVLQAKDKEINILKSKMRNLQDQKKGLMQKLLTGKKRLFI